LRRRLQDHGAAGRNRRSYFVRYQIKWEIERRDSCHWADRKPPNHSPAARREFLPVERQHFAVDASALFSSYIEGEDRAIYLCARSLDGLAGLQAQSARKLLFPFGDILRYLPQHPLPFEGRQTTRRTKSFYCRCNRRVGVFLPPLHYTGDDAAVVWGANFNQIALFDPSSIH